MLTTPTLHEVAQGHRGMLRGVEAALDAQCMVSAVTLCYATIDALSALSRPEGQRETNRTVFIAWINNYLLPAPGLDCAAIDLYGARCGVLHTYRPESGLSATGEARPIYYQWQNGPPAAYERDLPANAVIVNVESLVQAVRTGVEKFAAAERANRQLSERIAHHMSDLLCYVPG